jgi:2-(3-amino-3-carboxypropyl)histidine synthase
MVLDFQEDYLFAELKKRKPKKVLVQLPEGIKTKAIELKEKIEELGIEVVFSGETAWGGCCIAIDEAKQLGADLIVHFGHSEYVKTKLPVIYVEMQDKIDFNKILKKSLDKLKKFKTIGLSYSVQHKGDSQKIKKFYEEIGKKVIFSKNKGRISYEGQIIGCEYSGLKEIEKEVDAFLIVGNRFHSLGAALALNKPVYLLDVYNDEISEMSEAKEKIIQQRFSAIEKAKKAKNIGVIIEAKIGQKFGNTDEIIEKIKKAGKNPILITMNELSQDKLTNFYNIDAFIELACPRIAIDDFAIYKKPLLTFKEALVVLGEKSWEELLNEGML